jgi:hypothetical protein
VEEEAAVPVDGGGRLEVGGSLAEPAQSGSDISFVAWQSDPVLEDVPRLRWVRRGSDQQEAGNALFG